MSWFSDLFGGHKKPPPPPPPPVPTYTVRVEVFEGDPARDEKIVNADVRFANRESFTDGAGNVEFPNVRGGTYPMRVTADTFLPHEAMVLVPGPATQVSLARDVPPIVALTTDRQIFRAGGQPWRWKGVSAFKLARRFADGENIDPFLDAYAGYNLLRVWDYVTWPVGGWESLGADDWLAFCAYVGARGWYVELTLLTDDDQNRLWSAGLLVEKLALNRPPNLLLEIGNEPTTHKNINTAALRSVLDASGFLYSSGDYEDSDRWFGAYYTNHTARTPDWPRRAHDLYEFYTGDGPDKATHPHHVPCVADEPGKPQDVGAILTEWRAYFGACSLMGAGATFHCDSGKLCTLPTEQERLLAATALAALNAFPADAPFGVYRRIVEPGQGLTPRTYVVGSYAVRCQQQGTAFPESGWRSLDPGGILWTR